MWKSLKELICIRATVIIVLMHWRESKPIKRRVIPPHLSSWPKKPWALSHIILNINNYISMIHCVVCCMHSCTYVRKPVFSSTIFLSKLWVFSEKRTKNEKGLTKVVLEHPQFRKMDLGGWQNYRKAHIVHLAVSPGLGFRWKGDPTT